MDMRGNDARLIRRLQNYGARAIAEQHGGTAVFPVGDLGQRFAAYYECSRRPTRLQLASREIQRIDEPRTRRLDVHGRTALNAKLSLDDAGSAREHLIGRYGADDDQVDVGGLDAGHVDGLPRGSQRHVRAFLILSRNMPSANARALLDPFVRSVHGLLEILVGDHFFRQIAACAGNS